MCRTILAADKDTSVIYMHNELQLLALKQRRIQHQAMDCFSNMTNEEAGLHDMYVTIDSRRRATRNTGTTFMMVPDVRSNQGRQAYSYKGTTFWNSLDSETRQIESKMTIKSHISKAVCRDVNHHG